MRLTRLRVVARRETNEREKYARERVTGLVLLVPRSDEGLTLETSAF